MIYGGPCSWVTWFSVSGVGLQRTHGSVALDSRSCGSCGLGHSESVSFSPPQRSFLHMPSGRRLSKEISSALLLPATLAPFGEDTATRRALSCHDESGRHKGGASHSSTCHDSTDMQSMRHCLTYLFTTGSCVGSAGSRTCRSRLEWITPCDISSTPAHACWQRQTQDT